MEEDIHGPGLDARGATFPGVNLWILLGHGRDYAWSATTATSDNVDTFAEVLCQDNFHYLYKGQCRPMEELDRTNTWTPNAVDSTPPGSETLKAYRTVHGIVFARGTVRRQEGGLRQRPQHVLPRGRLGALLLAHERPARSCGTAGVVQAGRRRRSNFAFNWSYIDSKHIAYYLTGWYPRRAPGTSPDFPVLGTGRLRLAGVQPVDPRGRLAADRQPSARGRPALPGLVEQQAGAGMGGRRRPVRLRADPPPAADRRPGPGRHRRRSQDQPGRARPVDGGARDRGPSGGEAPAHDPPGGWHPAIPRASQRDRVATELACGRRPSP